MKSGDVLLPGLTSNRSGGGWTANASPADTVPFRMEEHRLRSRVQGIDRMASVSTGLPRVRLCMPAISTLPSRLRDFL